jgi:hypothetical protein
LRGGGTRGEKALRSDHRRGDEATGVGYGGWKLGDGTLGFASADCGFVESLLRWASSGTPRDGFWVLADPSGKSEVCPAVALAPRPLLEACDAVGTTVWMSAPARQYPSRRRQCVEDLLAVGSGLQQCECWGRLR